MSYYILDDNGQPLKVDDVLAWSQWFEDKNKRIVTQTIIGDVMVSTVFLAIDHNWGDGPPVLWETMIFGGQHDQYQKRYTSLEDAIAGHAAALAMVMHNGPETDA